MQTCSCFKASKKKANKQKKQTGKVENHEVLRQRNVVVKQANKRKQKQTSKDKNKTSFQNK